MPSARFVYPARPMVTLHITPSRALHIDCRRHAVAVEEAHDLVGHTPGQPGGAIGGVLVTYRAPTATGPGGIVTAEVFMPTIVEHATLARNANPRTDSSIIVPRKRLVVPGR